MAKKQLKEYKFVPGYVPGDSGVYPGAVTLLTSNRDYLVEEVVTFVNWASSTPGSAPTAYPNAIARLTNNKSFIQEEANAWIENQIENAIDGDPWFGYDYTATVEARVRSDIGLVIDGFINDISGGGNADTYRWGRNYYRNGVLQLSDPVEEASLYGFIKGLIASFVMTNSTYTPYQVVVAINQTGTTGETAAVTKSNTLSDVIINVITNGVGSLPTLSYNYNSEFVGYTYDETEFRRDTGYIIDSYIYDLQYGGNSLTWYVASRYWVNGVAQIDGNRQPEIQAHTFARNLINNFILQRKFAASYQLVQIQTAPSAATNENANTKITTLANIITGTIENGLSVLPRNDAPNGISNNLVPNAVSLIERNKRYIAAEAAEYIAYNTANNIAPFTFFTYNSAKCQRDVSYIIEGYISDLKSGGNRQTVFNAAKYWENGVAAVDGSRQPEISTHTFIRDLIDNFILNNVSYSSKQDQYKQVLDGSTIPEVFAKTRIKELSNTIIDVIQYGLDYLPATVSNRGYVKIVGFYKQKDFLVVTNTSRNQILYNFADPGTSGEVTYSEFDDSDFPAFTMIADQVTKLTFDADTSGHMVTDNIQIFVEGKEQVVHMNSSASDAMERMKVGLPQAMLDADFEYGLQPTKWQAISTVRSYPSVYEIPGSEISVSSVTTDASSGTSGVGASLITVTTLGPHGLEVGDPITIKALENTISGFSRAEGSFLIVAVPSSTTFQYYSKSKVGVNNGDVLATTYTQLREAAFYTGAQIGIPTFDVFSNGSSGSFTSNLTVGAGVDYIGFTGTVPPVGAPIVSGTGVTAGTQVTSAVGSGGVEASTTLTNTSEVGQSTLVVTDTTGIQPGLVFNRGDGTAVRVTDVTGSTVSLAGELTSRILGTNASYTGRTGTGGTGTGAVFTVSRSGATYTATASNPGQGYVAGDTITVLGSNLDGVDTTNDATLTVATASNLNTVSTFDNNTLFGGTGYVQTTNLATNTTGSGTGLTVNTTLDGNGTIQTISVNNGGTNYAPGDTIRVSQGLPNNVSLNNPGSGYTTGTRTTTTTSGSGTGLTVNIVAAPSGGVQTGTVSNGGSGYTSSTGANVTGGTGTGASFDYQADAPGAINTASITNGGSGYTAGFYDTVNISSTGTGFQANISVTGGATGVSIVFGGSGYSDTIGNATTSFGGGGTGLTVNTTTTAGAITTIAVNAGGSGYSVGEQITINGGNNNASAQVTSIDGVGAITSLTVFNSGSGYAVNDTVYVNDPGSNFDSVITILSVSAGSVTTVQITNPGSGYTVGDVLTIVGGNNDATYTVSTVTNQQITSVNIATGGSGYVQGDTVTIDGGTGGQLQITGVNAEAQVNVASVSAGGLIQSLTASGTPVTAAAQNFISAVNLSAATTALVPSGTTFTYSAIATIEVTFQSAHGLVPGNSITVDITSDGTNHDLAAGPYYIEAVPTKTSLRYTARTSGTIDIGTTGLDGTVYPRPDSFYVHRPFDGGVQLGTGGPQHSAGAVRMSKKYIRYQSGKGVMYNTGALFAPSYDLASATASGTSAGSTITITTDDTDHGTQVGCGITISGVATPGYNGQYTVTNIISERVFTVQAQKTLGSTTAELSDDCKMSVRTWHGATVRAGAFDDQNGLFWQYDGKNLAVVKRSSTFQVAGVCSIQADKNEVTGVNTRFTNQLQAGDKIVIRGMTHTVTDITSDTVMTVSPDFRGVRNVADIKIAKVVDTIVPQSSWNIDTCDGSGASGYNIDITKMQMIGLQYTWYGAGFIDFMLRGSDGNYVFCHRMRNSNVNTEAFMRTGNLPVRYEVTNEGPNGRLSADMTSVQTTIPMDDTSWFPDSGVVYVGNELIAFTGRTNTQLTGCTRAASLTQFASGSQRQYTAGPATTHTKLTGVVLVSSTCTPIISHWGSAFLIDGKFDDDRGYIFSYAESNLTVSTTKQTAFMIRLAPSVSNAITGDLGERELLNRAQLLLQGLEITSDGTDGTNPILGGIIVEGVINPQNYPIAPSDVGWSGLTSTSQGGQPSFAQIAAGGSITWDSGGTSSTADIQAQSAMQTTAVTNDSSPNNRDFIYMRWSTAAGMDGKNIQAGDAITGNGIRNGTTVTNVSAPYPFNGFLEVEVTLSQRTNSSVSAGTTMTFSRGGDLKDRNFGLFTTASVDTAGVVSGTQVNVTGSTVTFPANTSVNSITLETFGSSSYYVITFNNTYTGILTGGTGTVQFLFQQPPYAQPGETVFSFIAAPGERANLSLDQLKELTNTTVGGRGTFPNGPDVLAINIYKATGADVNANVVLRWSEAQA